MFDLKGILDPVVAIINKVVPDKAAAAAAQAQLKTLALQGQLQEEFAQITAVTTAQSDVDKVEAASSSVFVAGARPAALWVCVLGMFSQFIVAPFATWVAALLNHPIVYPSLNENTLMTLLFGMLGLGAYHAAENIKGANHG